MKGRKREVYQALVNAKGGWVGGPALANVACGGSEGLRRLRVARNGVQHRKKES